MNLMFYNFNDFNKSSEAPNGRRPTAGGPNSDGRRPVIAGSGTQTQGGTRTQNNFYKNKNLLENEELINNDNSKGTKSGQDQKVVGSIHPIGPSGVIPPGNNIHETTNINVAGDRVPTRER